MIRRYKKLLVHSVNFCLMEKRRDLRWKTERKGQKCLKNACWASSSRDELVGKAEYEIKLACSSFELERIHFKQVVDK
jgi:hypothetical protein